MPIRDDIDIVRSVQMLLRSRLPNIINLSISRSPNALRMLVDQCRITLRQLCALVIRANTRGQDGILEVFEQLVVSHHNSKENKQLYFLVIVLLDTLYGWYAT